MIVSDKFENEWWGNCSWFWGGGGKEASHKHQILLWHTKDETRKVKSHLLEKSLVVSLFNSNSRLMANPEKPVHIPERPQDRNVNKAAEFCHNIMGR